MSSRQAEPKPGASPEALTRALLAWYDGHRRDLPWRRTRDPYAIWVAEVMLQQTQVQTVIPYYQRFLQRFPTVEALAAADPAEVLKVWEGLGYYGRARRLQEAAREVVRRFGGQLPADYQQLRSLPGIGPYTAGAILSIAFGIPAPAIDGNAARVLARLAAVEGLPTRPAVRRQLEAVARQLLPADAAGTFTQALMELGGAVCTPRSPQCPACPLAAGCLAYQQGRAEELPTRPSPRAVPVHQLAVAVLCQQPHAGEPLWLVRQRPLQGLLAGLWEFPACRRLEDEPWPEVARRALRGALAVAGCPEAEPMAAPLAPLVGAADRPISPDEGLGPVRHTFSHQVWEMRAFLWQVPALAGYAGDSGCDGALLVAEGTTPVAAAGDVPDLGVPGPTGILAGPNRVAPKGGKGEAWRWVTAAQLKELPFSGAHRWVRQALGL